MARIPYGREILCQEFQNGIQYYVTNSFSIIIEKNISTEETVTAEARIIVKDRNIMVMRVDVAE